LKRETLAVVLVVLVAAGLAAGYVAGVSSRQFATETTTRFVPTTVIRTATSNETRTSCFQTGIHGTLFVRVVSNETDSPVAGANVTATVLNYCWPTYQVALGLTNSSGYAEFPVNWTGVFLVNVTLAREPNTTGVTYVFMAETSGAVSLATLSIPSGAMTGKPIACYIGFIGCSNTTTTATAYIIG
jgi:hypothetical protein